MSRFKLFLVLCLTLTATACSTTTRVYYWERPNTGADHFVRDHKKCLQTADWWPFSFYNPLPNMPEDRDLVLNLKNGGIWANFSPYRGAMPIFVNNANPSKTLIYWRYSRCMKNAGYSERRPYTGAPASY